MLNCRKNIAIFCLIIGFMMLNSCKNSISKDASMKMTETYQSITVDSNGFFKGEIIVDKNMARKYADIIMTNRLKENIEDYKIIDITYNSDEKIWLVNYCIDKYTLGGGISIEISKVDGAVREIQYGE